MVTLYKNQYCKIPDILRINIVTIDFKQLIFNI